jgi:hypothetical protein
MIEWDKKVNKIFFCCVACVLFCQMFFWVGEIFFFLWQTSHKKMSAGSPKSRKRACPTLDDVWRAFDSPPELEAMRALLRKTNLSYQEAFGDSFLPLIETAQDVSELMPFYRIYCDAKAVESMGKCLLYYKQAHNFVYTCSDEKIIARAATRPTKCTVAQVRALFDHYLRDVEQVHHYYAKRRPKPLAAKRPMMPYNAFVKDQWAARAEEFKAIPPAERFAAVNKILTQEWKSPDTRLKYK